MLTDPVGFNVNGGDVALRTQALEGCHKCAKGERVHESAAAVTASYLHSTPAARNTRICTTTVEKGFLVFVYSRKTIILGRVKCELRFSCPQMCDGWRVEDLRVMV